MAELALTTPEGCVLRQELAGAGSRFAAALVDLALVVGATAALALALLVLMQLDATGASQLLYGALAGGLPLAALVYFVAFHVRGGGRTPGKRALGLRVLADDGFAATPLQHLLRTLVWPLDAVPLPLSIGLGAMLANERHQRLGDLVAGTVVVREDRSWRRPEPFPNETWSGLAERRLNLVPGLAARLDEEDLAFLRELLARAGLAEDERRRLFVRVARHYAARLELGSFDDARVVLKELFLYVREARAPLGRGRA